MIASPALWRIMSARGRIFTPVAQPGHCWQARRGEEFVRGVRPRAASSRKRTLGKDGWQRERRACEMPARKQGCSRLSLRPRETEGTGGGAIGSLLFWRGCKAFEILLTRIFAEQYYRTRRVWAKGCRNTQGGPHRFRPIGGRCGGARRYPGRARDRPKGAHPCGSRPRAEYRRTAKKGSLGATNIHRSSPPRDGRGKDLPRTRANFFGVEIGGVPL